MYDRRCRASRLTGLVCAGTLALAWAAAAFGAGDGAARLEAVRARLVREVATRAAADAEAGPSDDWHLTLDAGADQEDVRLVLRRRGGRWAWGKAAVPYWRQETQKEKFSFLHRSGVQSTRLDKAVYPLDASGLVAEGDALTGTLEATFRLNRLREDRMPPGGRHLFSTDGRWGLLDRWRITAHRTPREQRFRLDAALLDGVRDVTLTLREGMDGKPVTLRCRVPARPWEAPEVVAPTFNASVHQADTSGLAWDDGTLRGSATVRFVPDPWYPKQVHHVRYEVEARETPVGLRGTFRARVTGTEDIQVAGQSKGRRTREGPGAWTGSVAGVAPRAVEGRYRAEGDLGTYVGRVHGAVSPAATDVAAVLDAMVPDDADAAPAARAARLYADVRALRAALAMYPVPPAATVAATRLPPPVWPDGREAAAEAYASTLADLAEASGEADGATVVHGRPRPKDWRFGPWYGATPLEGGGDGAARLAVETDGPQRWQFIPTWRVLGPMPRPEGRAVLLSDLPDVLPAPAEATYGPNPADPDGQPVRWTGVAARGDGRLEPPAWAPARKNEAAAPGLPESVWYAAAEVASPAAQTVWVALAAHDHGCLWLNDRLVWVDAEREWGWAEDEVAVFPVTLRKGTNRLLARVRDDRGGSWLALHVCTRGGPAETVPPEDAGMDVARGDRWVPEASPPVAWDLEAGTNVAWRTAVPGGGGSRPRVDGDRVYVNTREGTLHCLDRATGAIRWSTTHSLFDVVDPAIGKAYEAAASQKDKRRVLRDRLGLREVGHESRPAAGDNRVFVHDGMGLLVAMDAEGTRLWRRATYMAEASVQLVGGRLVVAGAATPGWAEAYGVEAGNLTGKITRRAGHYYAGHGGHRSDKDEGPGPRHGMMALDPVTGEPRWATAVAGEFGDAPLVVEPAGGPAVLVTRSGQVLAPETGEVLCDRPELGAWDWQAAFASGDTVYTAWEGGRAAARVLADPAGQVALVPVWHGERLHAYIAGGPNDGVRRGDRFYVWRRVHEHAKHCPAYALELDWYATRTGEHLGWLKPVIRGTNRAVAPLAAGRTLYCGDTRGGPHTGGTPEERQVVAIDTDGAPAVVARSGAPHLSGTPVAAGEQLFLRLGGEVVCVAVTDDAGRRYQDEVMAETLLAGLYDVPKASALPVVEPAAAAVLPSECPVVPLESDETIATWVAAGPFEAHPDEAAPASLGTGGAVPGPGTEVTVAGETRSLEPLGRDLVQVTTGFTNDGRLDDWQQRRTVRRIDVRPLGEGRPGAVAYLFTMLDCRRDQVAYPTMAAPGMETWLSGRKVAAGEPVRLRAGLHPLLVKVRIDRFQRTAPQPPVDVAAAAQAGALTPIGWPATWQVVGPVTEALGAPEAEALASVPEALTFGETRLAARALPAIGRSLDFSALVDLAPGEAPAVGDAVRTDVRVPKGASVYAFARIDCPADGTLLVNASADWHMAWYVDGTLACSTLRQGNQRAPTQLTAHTFAVPVAKGTHVLAVQVKPGSKGWSLTSYGALATGAAEGLEAYAAKDGVRVPEPEFRAAPALRVLDTPEAVEGVWEAQIRANRGRLEHIVEALPGTDAGRRARAHLDALKR